MSYRLLVAILGTATLALFIVSLLVGPAGLDVVTSTTALLSEENKAAAIVMREIRLPRAILGVMIGATLGLSGAVLQGYLRNPLADPSVLGVSGAASLGAVIAIYTGASAVVALALPLCAIAGAILAVPFAAVVKIVVNEAGRPRRERMAALRAAPEPPGAP